MHFPASRCMSKTGVDFVMIGRGAQGRPWVFKQIDHYLRTGQLLPDPSLAEKMEILLRHPPAVRLQRREDWDA